MVTIQELCPNLRRLEVPWYEHFGTPAFESEDWIIELQKLNKLTELKVKSLDLKTSKFSSILPKIGVNLTTLELRDLWIFKYSNFRNIKLNCPNLAHLTMAMTTKSVIHSLNQIKVDKDHNLQLNGSEDRCDLEHLVTFHLQGPLGHEAVSYLLKGVKKLR